MAVKFNRFMALAMCATALTPVAAYAQTETEETAASDERRFGAIVVTAQRREENLLDVPLSVSAFSGDLLADLGI